MWKSKAVRAMTWSWREHGRPLAEDTDYGSVIETLAIILNRAGTIAIPWQRTRSIMLVSQRYNAERRTRHRDGRNRCSSERSWIRKNSAIVPARPAEFLRIQLPVNSCESSYRYFDVSNRFEEHRLRPIDAHGTVVNGSSTTSANIPGNSSHVAKHASTV